MRVIVSETLSRSNYRGYKVVSSLREVVRLTGIKTLILHSHPEETSEAGVLVAELRSKGVEQFYIISDSISATTKLVVSGVGGVILEDESYYNDERELDALLEMNSLEIVSGGAETSLRVITDYIKAFARGEQRVHYPVYLQQVNSALETLGVTYKDMELKVQETTLTALSVFEIASEAVQSTEKQIAKLQEDFERTEEEYNKAMAEIERHKSIIEASASTPSAISRGMGANIQYFQPHTYQGGKNVLLVRELTPCRYLTTLMLFLHHYISHAKNRKVKLIFVVQKNSGVSKKYTDMTTITQESMNNKQLYTRDVVVTNNPKREVMTELLSQAGDEIVIVVDRLYGTQDILNGRIKKINAISGASDFARYGVEPENCISTVTNYTGVKVHVPLIQGYGTDKTSRQSAYLKHCRDAMDTLYSIVQ